MPYIERSLGEGETVIAHAQFHWLYSLSAWIQLLVPAALLVWALLWFLTFGVIEKSVSLAGLVTVAFVFAAAKMGAVSRRNGIAGDAIAMGISTVL